MQCREDPDAGRTSRRDDRPHHPDHDGKCQQYGDLPSRDGQTEAELRQGFDHQPGETDPDDGAEDPPIADVITLS